MNGVAHELNGIHTTATLENTRWYNGHLMTLLLDGAATGGSFSLVDFVIRQGFEPPPHTHANEDETYLVTEGEIEFMMGEERVTAGPGSCVFLPRGVIHGFRLLTPIARAQIVMSPAGLEDAFIATSTPAERMELPPIPESIDVPKMLQEFGGRGVVFAPPGSKE